MSKIFSKNRAKYWTIRSIMLFTSRGYFHCCALYVYVITQMLPRKKLTVKITAWTGMPGASVIYVAIIVILLDIYMLRCFTISLSFSTHFADNLSFCGTFTFYATLRCCMSSLQISMPIICAQLSGSLLLLSTGNYENNLIKRRKKLLSVGQPDNWINCQPKW